MSGTMPELLPCPFCGSADLEISDLDEETCVVDCKKCLSNGGYYPGDDSTQPYEAAELWNKRTDRIDPALLAAIDRMLGYYDGDREDYLIDDNIKGGMTVGQLRKLRGMFG